MQIGCFPPLASYICKHKGTKAREVRDTLRHWWQTYGSQQYANATSILILCDGGGSNSSRHYLFKQDLQALVDELGLEIRIAHYPLYTSKCNPHRTLAVPPYQSRLAGGSFHSVEMVRDLIATTTTRKWLKVHASVLDKHYKTGRKVAKYFK